MITPQTARNTTLTSSHLTLRARQIPMPPPPPPPPPRYNAECFSKKSIDVLIVSNPTFVWCIYGSSAHTQLKATSACPHPVQGHLCMPTHSSRPPLHAHTQFKATTACPHPVQGHLCMPTHSSRLHTVQGHLCMPTPSPRPPLRAHTRAADNSQSSDNFWSKLLFVHAH